LGGIHPGVLVGLRLPEYDESDVADCDCCSALIMNEEIAKAERVITRPTVALISIPLALSTNFEFPAEVIQIKPA
jgi:hypothetical protein